MPEDKEGGLQQNPADGPKKTPDPGPPAEKQDGAAGSNDQFHIRIGSAPGSTIGSGTTVNYNGLNAQDLQGLVHSWRQADREYLKDLTEMLQSTANASRDSSGV